MALHGYPDYQPPGVVIPTSGESPPLETVEKVERVGKHEGFVLEVGLYSHVRIRLPEDAKGGYLVLTLKWYTDAELTRPAGERIFAVSPKGVGPEGVFIASVANLGGYLVVSVAPIAGEAAKWETEYEVVGHNRQAFTECPIISPVLGATKGEEKVNNLSAYALLPKYYASGPIAVSMWSSKVKYNGVVLVAYDPVAKEWAGICDRELGAADTWEQFTFLAPTGAWKLQAFNATGEEALLQLLIAPSTLGTS